MEGRWVAVMCAALLATGCGGDVEGAPVADEPAKAWDPCSIPADAIAAAGLHPQVEREGWGVLDLPDWDPCLWTGPADDAQYFFSVMISTTISIEELQADPRLTDFSEIYFDDRVALSFSTTAFDKSRRCELAFDSAHGVLRLYVTAMGGIEMIRPPCQVVAELAAALSPAVPR